MRNRLGRKWMVVWWIRICPCVSLSARQERFWGGMEMWCRAFLTSASDLRECLASRPLILVHIVWEAGWRRGRSASGDEENNKVSLWEIKSEIAQIQVLSLCRLLGAEGIRNNSHFSTALHLILWLEWGLQWASHWVTWALTATVTDGTRKQNMSY